MEKDYLIRAYIFKGDEEAGNWLNGLIDAGDKVDHINTVLGIGTLICFYDLFCSHEVVQALYMHRCAFLPMNNFGDFVIETEAGERIDDDMIIRDYSEPVLRGFNIKTDEGYEFANVKLLCT